MVKVPGQVRDTVNKQISVQLGAFASIFGLFGAAQDRTPPSTALQVTGPQFLDPIGNIYTSSAALFGFSAVDPVVRATGTGVAFTEYRVDADSPSAAFARYELPLPLPPGRHLIEYRSQDNAGNLEPALSSVVVVDTITPGIALAAPLGGEVFTARRSSISVEFSVTSEHEFGPAPAVSASLVQLEDRGSPRAGRPASVAVQSGQLLDPLDIDDGLWRLEALASDFVGNSTAASSGPFEVLHDVQPPNTSLVIGTPSFAVGGSTWVSLAATLSLSATDDLLLPGDGQGLGGVQLWLAVDSDTFNVVAGTFTLQAEGEHILRFFSADAVGNIESTRTATILADGSPPETALNLGEPRISAAGTEIISPRTPISLAASDPSLPVSATGPAPPSSDPDLALSSSAPGSGVSAVMYKLDSGPVLVYSGTFTVVTEGPHIIEYWSVDHVANVEPARTGAVQAARFLAAGLSALDRLTGSGSSVVQGDVLSNGVVELAGMAKVQGDVTAASVRLSGKAAVQGAVAQSPAGLSTGPVDLWGILEEAVRSNSNSLIPAGFLTGGRLEVAGLRTLSLSTGLYLLNGLAVSGNGTLEVRGKVRLVVQGGVTVAGQGRLNAGAAPSDLAVFVTSAAAASFSGSARAGLDLYAPMSHAEATGEAAVAGRLFARNIALSGRAVAAQSGVPRPGGGMVLAMALEPAGWGDGELEGMALTADPAFALRDVYVFPNPARAGAKPVIHAAVGIADRVRLRIFDVAGREVHSTTLDGRPAVIDDGTGPKYAYEYAWQGHIPSGVYLYVVEAEKAGAAPIRKAGRFGVVR